MRQVFVHVDKGNTLIKKHDALLLRSLSAVLFRGFKVLSYTYIHPAYSEKPREQQNSA